jgi:hypothetical protein
VGSWRAGCGETRTSGSEGGPGKRNSRKAGTAPWSDPYSWKLPVTTPPSLEDLRDKPVLAIDVNAGWLAAMVVDASGNPLRGPITIPL